MRTRRPKVHSTRRRRRRARSTSRANGAPRKSATAPLTRAAPTECHSGAPKPRTVAPMPSVAGEDLKSVATSGEKTTALATMIPAAEDPMARVLAFTELAELTQSVCRLHGIGGSRRGRHGGTKFVTREGRALQVHVLKT